MGEHGKTRTWHLLHVTQNETERMIRLVNDLLQLSKMDHKESALYKEKIDIIPVFHHILDRFDMNKAELIDIERKIPNERMFVWVDQDKITQVTDNIMSNAIKYSPEGGKITFQVVKQANNLRVSISDQGLGIAREKLDKIALLPGRQSTVKRTWRNWFGISYYQGNNRGSSRTDLGH